MEGDCYKRPRYGHRSPEEQLWLERRGISFTADSHDFPLLFSPQLPGKLAQDMRLLFPCTGFWNPPPRRSCAARRSRGFGRGDRSPIPRKGRGWLLFSQKFR